MWLDFIASLVDSLAWPLITLLILYTLRNPLLELMPFLKRLKIQNLELEFSDKLKELGSQASRTVPLTREATLTKRDSQDQILELLVVSRSAAIAEAWREVEEAAVDAARRHNIDVKLHNLNRFEKTLLENDIIDEQQAKIYSGLRSLRNSAVHEGDAAVSDSNALAFADLSIQLAEHLRGMK